jgi:hypothetical protein
MVFGEGYIPKKDFTFKSREELLIEAIEKASTIVNRAAKNGSGNYIICSPAIARILNDINV